MTGDLAGFIHRFESATAAKQPLLLLHGTGGDEADLLPLGRAVAPGAALLSLRGPVLERGMPRFFSRLTVGVFDEADVVRRAGDLANFVAAARRSYGLAAPLALGFSNGANMAAATLLLHPDAFAGAVLLRPMVPLTNPPPTDLTGTPVLMLTGAADPIAPVANARRLAGLLEATGAGVEHRIVPAGHGLSHDDVDAVWTWIGGRPAPGQV